MNFDRIAATIDVDAMQQSHVTSIGGAYGLLCDLARSGLGAVTLVDFDTISASNPARQDFYSTDLGQHKVEAAARYLKQINPNVEVECYVRDYCELSRDEHDRIFGDTDLFIYGTDFFPAQARESGSSPGGETSDLGGFVPRRAGRRDHLLRARGYAGLLPLHLFQPVSGVCRRRRNRQQYRRDDPRLKAGQRHCGPDRRRHCDPRRRQPHGAADRPTRKPQPPADQD